MLCVRGMVLRHEATDCCRGSGLFAVIVVREVEHGCVV
jgi:hypothetical protein